MSKNILIILALLFITMNDSHADIDIDLIDGDTTETSSNSNIQNKISPGMVVVSDKNVITYSYAKDKSYSVKLKALVTTVINLPENEKIIFFSLGDNQSFKARHTKEIPNLLRIETLENSAQTNLIIKTDIGSIYNFYLNSTTNEAPNFTVYITKLEEGEKKKFILKNLQENNSYIKKVKNLDKLNVLYSIKGDEEIAPIFVYDDGKWTYFDFGKNFVSDRLPNVYKVIDKYDSVINTRTEGNLVIATSLGVEGWTLKNGDKTVCIRPKKSLYKIYKDDKLK